MDTSNINPSGLAGLGIPTPTNSIPGIIGNSANTNPHPFNQPPPTMQSALNSAKSLGHINEQQLLQNSLSSVVESIEKSHLRPLQRESFLCSAKCCEHTDSTQQSFQRCLQNCNLNPQHAQQAVQHELQRFQQRIQRQQQDCQESARDIQMNGTSESDTQKYFKECTDGVFARNRQLIPDLQSRLNKMLTPTKME